MVSGRQAVAVQFMRDDAGLLLSACACSVVPEKIHEGSDHAIEWHRKTLMKKMRGSGFRGRKCVIGLNSVDLILRNYMIPRKRKMSVAAQIRERLFNDCGDSVKTSIARHLVVPERFLRQQSGEASIFASVILVPGMIMERRRPIGDAHTSGRRFYESESGTDHDRGNYTRALGAKRNMPNFVYELEDT
jgi:hypothetical protein